MSRTCMLLGSSARLGCGLGSQPLLQGSYPLKQGIHYLVPHLMDRLGFLDGMCANTVQLGVKLFLGRKPIFLSLFGFLLNLLGSLGWLRYFWVFCHFPPTPRV